MHRFHRPSGASATIGTLVRARSARPHGFRQRPGSPLDHEKGEVAEATVLIRSAVGVGEYRERTAPHGDPEMTLARRIGGGVAAAALAIWAPGALAADAPDPHAHHRHPMAPEAARTSAAYTVPDVELVRDDGKTVLLNQELNDGRPVVLSFIFTSCTTICPMISATLAQLQRKLGPARDQVHLVSISIDPEFDTPARLRVYARKFGAGPEWQHYGGTLAASLAAQRAFGVYRGDKMNHAPAT